jgi:integral membrane protein (TIGR01906 family)
MASMVSLCGGTALSKQGNTLFAVMLGILFPFIVFVTAIEGAVFDEHFFMQQMAVNQVVENTGIYPDDMEPVVTQILSFLSGHRADFDIQARLTSKNDKQAPTVAVSIFNAKEISHMNDVRNLLLFFLSLRDIMLAVALICLVILLTTKPAQICQALFWGSAAFLGLFIVIGFCFYFNFTASFNLFHKLFFSNDLWLMDPETDRIIWIVPEPFFVSLIARMTLYTLIPLFITTAASALLLYRKNKPKAV